MKSLLLKCALLAVLFYFFLMILAHLIFQVSEPPVNPFAAYGSYMPGASVNALRDCDYYYIEDIGAFYAVCNFSNGAFRRVGMMGDSGRIRQSWFYTVDGSLRLPTLMALFGKWEFFRANHGAMVRWPGGIVVNIADWHGMASYVDRIAFVSREDGR